MVLDQASFDMGGGVACTVQKSALVLLYILPVSEGLPSLHKH